MPETLLIVDDEPDLVATLAWNLQREGYLVRKAFEGRQALALAAQEPLPGLVLLDLMLPDMSGVEVCRRLRADPRTSAVPVLMLTARAEEHDRVVGFEAGADDYVCKPFSVRELLLRVQAILRRSASGARPGAAASTSQRFGVLEVDEDAHRVRVEGIEVHLTAIEFRLLLTLLQRRGRVQTRGGLLSEVWGDDVHVTQRTVDTHVKRLREKLGAAGEYVQTVRGVGYRFQAEEPGT
jgi:two-component system phosphate regulon response regulator PhoB